jgi:tetratricopeptide (TPR) repeat protein
LVLSFSVLLVYALVIGHEAFCQDDFAQRYQAYQLLVSDGKAGLDRKDYQVAVENYTKEIAASPFVASHYVDRGVALYRKGDGKKAEEDFSRAIILDPRMASAYTYRGLVRMKGGDQEGALKDYTMALGLTPKDPRVHNNLAWLYATAKDDKLQDKVKALEHAVRAVEMTNEKNVEVLDTLARAYFINGKAAEAVETEKKAIELEPENRAPGRTLRSIRGEQNSRPGSHIIAIVSRIIKLQRRYKPCVRKSYTLRCNTRDGSRCGDVLSVMGNPGSLDPSAAPICHERWTRFRRPEPEVACSTAV